MPTLLIGRHGPRLSPTYGMPAGRSQVVRRGIAGLALVVAVAFGVLPAQARTLQIVALGDSLSAGYLLPADAAFPAVLQDALRKDGFDVAVANAGVSGDRAADGLARLDWSVPEGTDGVIMELGANDMLRGLDPATMQTTLGTILARLQARKIKVLLAGMRAMPSLGPDYTARFDAAFPALAKQYDVPLYPFFLEGVAQDRNLRQPDGMHPTAAGVTIMVKTMLPAVEAWLRSVAPKS